MHCLTFFLLLFAWFIQVSVSALNPKLLKIEANSPSVEMQKFITYIIHKNSHEKDGFLFVMINKIEQEFSDFAAKTINKNSSLIIWNFDIDKITQPLLNPNHFKFVFVDPEGELSHAGSTFRKVRISRAKIVLIITRTPASLFVTYLLNSYWKIQCISVILVYESNGQVEVITFNPFLTTNKYVNLTAAKYRDGLFKDKAENLNGYQINALLTYSDRTKVIKSDSNGEIYQGKDFVALATIISHLNGQLSVLNLENMTENPWFQSLQIGNKLQARKEIIKSRQISLLIKSESFTVNDGVVENLYPHTQNDLVVVVPKSKTLPLIVRIAHILGSHVWILYNIAPLIMLLIIIALKQLLNSNVDILPIAFTIWRILLVNNATFNFKPLLNIILLAWLFYGFLINVAIQSKVTSLLTVKTYSPEIDTIDLLLKAKLKVMASPVDIEEIRKKYEGTRYGMFADSLIPAHMLEEELDGIIREGQEIGADREVAFILENDLAVYMARNRLYMSDGAPKYHRVRESLVPSYQSYKLSHGSPLVPMLDKQLRRLTEGGFIKLWSDRTIYLATIEGVLNPEDYDESYRVIKPLSMDLIQSSCYVLFSGYFVALVSFVIELWWLKRRSTSTIVFRP